MAGTALFREVDLSGFGYTGVAHAGHGHSASAQLVRDQDTEELFIAKCISLAALSQRDAQLAHQEVFLLQELLHPLIVSYHDSFVIDGTNILVILMEYCEGGDLRKLITSKSESGSHFSEEEVMTYFVQIVQALEYIHSVKVLHRDLKTSNIFLKTEADGRTVVKLGDFGISRVLEGTCDAAVTMVGTPYYMSPEVCRSEPYSWKSDVWALGCVLYEMCMLKHAFESSSLMGLVYKIVSDNYEPIPSFYSQELNDLLRQLLDKQADKRPSVEGLLASPYIQAHAQRVGPFRASGSQPRASRVASRQQCQDALANGVPGMQAGSPPPSAPGAITCGPRTRLLVLASRIRHRLVAHRMNWITAFASFDDIGDGTLSAETMRDALVGLRLGLSAEEVNLLVDSLSEGSRVPLSSFESKLVEATSIEAYQLAVTAKRLMEPKAVLIAPALRARDAQQELLPDLTPEMQDLLLLLADKNEAGEIDYLRFAEEYAPSSMSGPSELAPWPAWMGAPPPPPPVPGPPLEATGNSSYFQTCQPPDFSR